MWVRLPRRSCRGGSPRDRRAWRTVPPLARVVMPDVAAAWMPRLLRSPIASRTRPARSFERHGPTEDRRRPALRDLDRPRRHRPRPRQWRPSRRWPRSSLRERSAVACSLLERFAVLDRGHWESPATPPRPHAPLLPTAHRTLGREAIARDAGRFSSPLLDEDGAWQVGLAERPVDPPGTSRLARRERQYHDDERRRETRSEGRSGRRSIERLSRGAGREETRTF